MSQEPKLHDDELRNSAQQAAKAAAESIESELLHQNKQDTNNFALYVWGGLAVVCAMFAATSLVIPLGGSGKSVVAGGERPIEPVVLELSENDETKLAKVDVKTIKQNANELDELTTGTVQNPDGQDVVKLGVNIGSSPDVKSLIKRYSALKRRAPELFTALQARVETASTAENPNSQLIAGPFDSVSEVATFCRAVKLNLTIECQAAKFAGKTLAELAE